MATFLTPEQEAMMQRELNRVKDTPFTLPNMMNVPFANPFIQNKKQAIEIPEVTKEEPVAPTPYSYTTPANVPPVTGYEGPDISKLQNRGVMGDILAGATAGAYNIATETPTNVLKIAGDIVGYEAQEPLERAGEAVSNYTKRFAEKTPFLQPSRAAVTSFSRGAIYGAASMGGSVATGFILPGKVLKAFGIGNKTSLGILSIPSFINARQKYLDEAEAAGKTMDLRTEMWGDVSGAISAASLFIGMAGMDKFVGRSNPITKIIGKAFEDWGKFNWKNIAGNVAKEAGVWGGTGWLASFGDAWLRKFTDVPTEDPLEIANSSLAPTVLFTTVFGLFATRGVNKQQRNIRNIIVDGNAPESARRGAAKVVSKTLESMGQKTLADNFDNLSHYFFTQKMPLPINESLASFISKHQNIDVKNSEIYKRYNPSVEIPGNAINNDVKTIRQYLEKNYGDTKTPEQLDDIAKRLSEAKTLRKDKLPVEDVTKEMGRGWGLQKYGGGKSIKDFKEETAVPVGESAPRMLPKEHINIIMDELRSVADKLTEKFIDPSRRDYFFDNKGSIRDTLSNSPIEDNLIYKWFIDNKKNLKDVKYGKKNSMKRIASSFEELMNTIEGRKPDTVESILGKPEVVEEVIPQEVEVAKEAPVEDVLPKVASETPSLEQSSDLLYFPQEAFPGKKYGDRVKVPFEIVGKGRVEKEYLILGTDKDMRFILKPVGEKIPTPEEGAIIEPKATGRVKTEEVARETKEAIPTTPVKESETVVPILNKKGENARLSEFFDHHVNVIGDVSEIQIINVAKDYLKRINKLGLKEKLPGVLSDITPSNKAIVKGALLKLIGRNPKSVLGIRVESILNSIAEEARQRNIKDLESLGQKTIAEEPVTVKPGDKILTPKGLASVEESDKPGEVDIAGTKVSGVDIAIEGGEKNVIREEDNSNLPSFIVNSKGEITNPYIKEVFDDWKVNTEKLYGGKYSEEELDGIIADIYKFKKELMTTLREETTDTSPGASVLRSNLEELFHVEERIEFESIWKGNRTIDLESYEAYKNYLKDRNAVIARNKEGELRGDIDFIINKEINDWRAGKMAAEDRGSKLYPGLGNFGTSFRLLMEHIGRKGLDGVGWGTEKFNRSYEFTPEQLELVKSYIEAKFDVELSKAEIKEIGDSPNAMSVAIDPETISVKVPKKTPRKTTKTKVVKTEEVKSEHEVILNDWSEGDNKWLENKLKDDSPETKTFVEDIISFPKEKEMIPDAGIPIEDSSTVTERSDLKMIRDYLERNYGEQKNSKQLDVMARRLFERETFYSEKEIEAAVSEQKGWESPVVLEKPVAKEVSISEPEKKLTYKEKIAKIKAEKAEAKTSLKEKLSKEKIVKTEEEQVAKEVTPSEKMMKLVLEGKLYGGEEAGSGLSIEKDANEFRFDLDLRKDNSVILKTPVYNVDTLTRIVTGMFRHLAKTPTIKIFENAEDAMKSEPTYRTGQVKDGDVAKFFPGYINSTSPLKGEIWLFADRLSSPREIFRTVKHELFHYAPEELFGNKWNVLCRAIHSLMKPNEIKYVIENWELSKRYKDLNSPSAQSTIGKEFFSEISRKFNLTEGVKSLPEGRIRTIYEKTIGQINKWFKEIFNVKELFKVQKENPEETTFKDDELINWLLNQSGEFLKTGKRYEDNAKLLNTVRKWQESFRGEDLDRALTTQKIISDSAMKEVEALCQAITNPNMDKEIAQDKDFKYLWDNATNYLSIKGDDLSKFVRNTSNPWMMSRDFPVYRSFVKTALNWNKFFNQKSHESLRALSNLWELPLSDRKNLDPIWIMGTLKDKHYTDNELREGVKVKDGRTISLNDKQIVVYHEVLNNYKELLERKFTGVEESLMEDFAEKKWFGLLKISLGKSLDQKDLGQFRDLFQKEYSAFQNPLKLLKDYMYDVFANEVNAKDMENITESIEKGTKKINKYLDGWEDNKGQHLGLRDMFRNALGESSRMTDEEIDSNLKEVFIAYGRVKNSLDKVSDLRKIAAKRVGYFPLVRKPGKYFLTAFNEKEERIFYDQYANTVSLELARQELMKQEKYKGVEFTKGRTNQDVEESTWQLSYFNTERMIEKSIENLKREGEIGPDVLNKLKLSVLDEISDEFKKRGFTSHEIERKSFIDEFGNERITEGFIETDLAEVTRNYIRGYWGLEARQNLSKDFFKVLGSPYGENKIKQNQPELYAELLDYAKNALRGQRSLDKTGGVIKQLGFIYYLGLTLRAPFMQMAQNFITGIPHLARLHKEYGGSVYGLKPEMYWIKASSDLATKNYSTKEENFLSDFDDKGITLDQYIQEIRNKIRSPFFKTQNFIAGDMFFYLFSEAEKFNRRSTALAAYRIIRDGGENVDLAYDKISDRVEDLVYNTHYLMGKLNYPRAIRGSGPVGTAARVAYTFKSYPHNFLLDLKNSLSKIGATDPTTGERKLNFDIVARQFTYMFLIGGLASMPFADDIMELFEKMTGKPLRIMAKKTLREKGGEAFEKLGYAGLPALIAGVDLTGSLKIQSPINLASPFSASSAEGVAGVASGLAKQVGKSIRYWRQGMPEEAMESLAPVGLSNLSKLYRMYLENDRSVKSQFGTPAYTKTGEKIQLTDQDAILKGLGFSPYRVKEASLVARSKQISEMKWQQRRNDIYDLVRFAKTNEDWAKIYKKRNEYEKDRIEAKALVPAIKASSILRAKLSKQNKGQKEFARVYQ